MHYFSKGYTSTESILKEYFQELWRIWDYTLLSSIYVACLMDTGRRHMTPCSETKDFIIAAGHSCMGLMFMLAPLSSRPMEVMLMGSSGCCTHSLSYSWGMSSIGNPNLYYLGSKQACVMSSMEGNTFYYTRK